MKTPPFRFAAAIVLLLAACATTTPNPDIFVGAYEGPAITDSDPYARSSVESLEITREGAAYSLSGYMNETNREPGMENTSDTRWEWSGTGLARGNSLEFTYSTPDDQHGAGSLIPKRGGLLLTLDSTHYQLHKSPP
jgi:hypothetical protein